MEERRVISGVSAGSCHGCCSEDEEGVGPGSQATWWKCTGSTREGMGLGGWSGGGSGRRGIAGGEGAGRRAVRRGVGPEVLGRVRK
jgi:hypothetical protein